MIDGARERSQAESLVEESERQMSQIHEISTRLKQLRERLIGTLPEDPPTEVAAPSAGGVFGALYTALYRSGQGIERCYDELRKIEKPLGINAEKHPPEPARLGKIGR